MSKRPQSRGFTLVEVLIVMSMTGVLAAIGLPKFFRAEKRAKHSEAVTNLKTLHAAMSTQAVMPTSIHVPGFDPERGNEYSYHLSDPCSSFEDRSTAFAVSNEQDDCIGVDTLRNHGLPSVFTPVQLPAVSWDMDGLMNGMTTSPGLYGYDTNWDYLAYAAGDLDKNPYDAADTWGIASADAQLVSMCPLEFVEFTPAGEPFLVNDDEQCD